MSAGVPATTLDELCARYDVFLLDAYGVLVSSSGALPGAAAFLARLRHEGKRYLVVSNDASRSPETSSARYAGFGLELDTSRILTSGLLIREHFAASGLVGARCIVLGTQDSKAYVRDAGGEIVEPADDSAGVLVVADDSGFKFLETLNEATSAVLRRMERGEHTHLLLPNPDLVFPLRPGAFGITAGAMAAMIEAILKLRDPSGAQRFVALGKPYEPMFAAAAGRFPGVDRRRMVMIGDQLGTDILGAQRFGIDSVLVETGVARRAEIAGSEARPSYMLPGLG